MAESALSVIGPDELRTMLGRSGGVLHDLTGQTFVDCEFSSLVLNTVPGARVSTFIRCDFSGADLFGVSFQDSVLQDCHFSGAQLGKCEFWGTQITDCTFDGALMIRSEFSRAVITGSTFRRADLLAASITESVLRRCIFDGADLSGALISGNEEDEVNWSKVTGLIRSAAVAGALAVPGTVGAAPTEAHFFAIAQQLVGTPLDDTAALGHLLGLRFVPGGGNGYFQLFTGKGQADSIFSAAELRQDRSRPARAIIILSLAPSLCIACERLPEQFGTLSTAPPVFTPPSPDATGSQEYLSLRLRGVKLSFGLTQQQPECLASITLDRLE